MKKQLLKFKFAGVAFALLSLTGFAQTGGPYGGTAPSIVNGTKIEFENFDLGGNANGGTAPFGYSDTTAGNVVATGTSYIPSTYRSSEGHDVDLGEHVQATQPQSNGQIGIASTAVNEFQYYTITVGETSSNYFFRINYGHGSATNKEYRIEKLNPSDLSVAAVLVDAPSDTSPDALPKTANSFTFGDYDTQAKFTLTAGETWVLKFTHLDSGPVFNYFQLINNPATLSVNDAKLGTKALKAFPNPSNNGVFNINLEGQWNVYSVLGVKVLEGNGKTIDLTHFAKGAYILKMGNESKMLISK